MIFGKRINKYYLKYAPLFIIGIVVLAVIDFAQLQIPKIYRILLTALNTGYADAEKTIEFSLDVLLNDICFPMLLIVLALLFGRFLWRVCFFGASVNTEEGLRREMFDHAKDLSQSFYSENKVGSLMSLFTNDLSTIEECFGWGVMMFFDALLLGVMSLYNMFTLQPVLAVLCLLPMALLAIVGSILNKYMMKKWDLREEAFSRISDFSQESFSGIAVIKAYVKEAKELWVFKKLNSENEKANVDFTKMSVALRVSVTFFVQSVICIILGFGGYLVYNKTVTAEALLEFVGYFTAIIWPIMAISELIDMSSRGKASLNRITSLLEAKIEVKDADNAVDAGVLNGKIEFKNLSFKYSENARTILDDLSFEINAGETVGIIGKIGAGKSTIVDLITKTYNVGNDKILLDGKDINGLTLKSIRRNIAYVPQDNFLFSETIADNIAFSSDEKDMDKIKKYASLACVSGDIESFPEGYDTVLGERGVTVSGGQKQRISIARALMKEAPILILDDSVSAVDTQTEKTLLENIFKTRKGKTTLIIAHRISTVERADRILFLERGKKLAFGTHEELLSTCPEYAKLVELQKLEEREENADV
ncbi:MAG: ABC transporter ATP-binding protein [Clostridia bacterium]|nr:ABC transporter ATP-binding protein [Clostridia bacterium]